MADRREPLTGAEAACLRYVELAARPVRDVEVTTVLLAAIWEEIDRDLKPENEGSK